MAVGTAFSNPATGMVAFFLNGWRFDDLYRFLFIRPYGWLAKVLWERVDEGVIDDSLDRLAGLLGRAGEGLGAGGFGAGRMASRRASSASNCWTAASTTRLRAARLE